jgi:hypothetical protein
MLEFGLKIYSKLYYFELEKLKKRREIKEITQKFTINI